LKALHVEAPMKNVDEAHVFELLGHSKELHPTLMSHSALKLA
jgi:hypothetical protein